MTAPTGTGTFAPRPGAAPYPKMVAAQARMETRLLLRNRPLDVWMHEQDVRRAIGRRYRRYACTGS